MRAITGRMLMQIPTQASACAACAMDGPMFRCTNTSRLPRLPLRADGSHQPAPDAAPDRRGLLGDK
jgi:hypothetical protein